MALDVSADIPVPVRAEVSRRFAELFTAPYGERRALLATLAPFAVDVTAADAFWPERHALGLRTEFPDNGARHE